MSARMLAVLRCDHDGCDERFAHANDDVKWKPPRLSETRRLAHIEGWRHGVRLRADSGPAPTFDYCSAHAGDVGELSEVIYTARVRAVPP